MIRLLSGFWPCWPEIAWLRTEDLLQHLEEILCQSQRPRADIAFSVLVRHGQMDEVCMLLKIRSLFSHSKESYQTVSSFWLRESPRWSVFCSWIGNPLSTKLGDCPWFKGSSFFLTACRVMCAVDLGLVTTFGLDSSHGHFEAVMREVPQFQQSLGEEHSFTLLEKPHWTTTNLAFQETWQTWQTRMHFGPCRIENRLFYQSSYHPFLWWELGTQPSAR